MSASAKKPVCFCITEKVMLEVAHRGDYLLHSTVPFLITELQLNCFGLQI